MLSPQHDERVRQKQRENVFVISVGLICVFLVVSRMCFVDSAAWGTKSAVKLRSEATPSTLAVPPVPLLSDSQLRSFLLSVSLEKEILLVVANVGYIDMLKNFFCRAKKLKISNAVVAALDDELYRYCSSAGIPVFRAQMPTGDPSHVVAGAVPIGKKEFSYLTKMKTVQLHRVLSLGFNVLVSDVDVHFRHNPLLPLQTLYPSSDLLVMSDRKMDSPAQHHFINTGFMYVRSSPASAAAMRIVMEHAEASNKTHDQFSFNEVLCGKNYEYRLEENSQLDSDSLEALSYCMPPKMNVRVQFLDQARFLNGDMWNWDVGVPRIGSRRYIAVHNNWNFGYSTKKKEMRSNGMWNLDSNGECRASLF